MTAPTPDKTKWLDWLLAGLLFAGSLVVYLHTMRPSFGWGDAAELTTAAYFLGIGHSPGYPTYMLFGYLFSHLPFETVAWRMNFMSAFFGALAVGLSYFVFRKIPCGRFGAFLGAATFAFTATLWNLTTEAEVYTLHAAFVAAIILLVLNWRQTGRPHLAWAALLAGISLGNHALTALLLPGIVLFVALHKGWRYLFSKPMLLAAGAFILGAMVYLYLPLRGPANPPPGVNDPQNFSQVLIQMTAPGSRQEMFSGPFREALFQVAFYGRKRLPYEVSWAGVALGLLGAGLLWRRDRKLFALLALLFACNILYAVNYRIFDIYVYYVTSYWVWCALIALGGAWIVAQLGQLAARLPREAGRQPGKIWGILAGALALLLPFCLLVDHWAKMDMSEDRAPEQFARAALQIAQPNSLILADWWPIAPLGYLKYIEGQRPDLTLVPAFSFSNKATYEKHIAPEFLRRFPAVYAAEMQTHYLKDLQEKYLMIPQGPLEQILVNGPQPELARTNYQGSPKFRFGQDLLLVGWEMSPKTARPGQLVEINLYWQIRAPLGKSDKFDVVLELINGKQESAWWEKSSLLHGVYPLADWRPGQTLQQRFIALPAAEAPPGRYELVLRMRERSDENRLLLARREKDQSREKSARLATLTVR